MKEDPKTKNGKESLQNSAEGSLPEAADLGTTHSSGRGGWWDTGIVSPKEKQWNKPDSFTCLTLLKKIVQVRERDWEENVSCLYKAKQMKQKLSTAEKNKTPRALGNEIIHDAS